MGVYSGGPGSLDPDRVTWGGVTLAGLIRNAWHLDFQQVSGPDWLNTQYYAVTATSPPGTTREEFRSMLANLLTNRFALTWHFAKKEITAYDLVVGRRSPKIAPAAPAADGSPTQPPPIPWIARRDGDLLRVTFRRTTMARLVNALSIIASPHNGSPPSVRIDDRTELTGEFDGDLAIEFDDDPVAGLPVGNISKALQKQLGLDLRQTRKKIDILVVDHAERIPRPD